MLIKDKRITGIQVLRAIAFLEIFLEHCGMGLCSGSFGAEIFIVLSGFCVAINHIQTGKKPNLSPINSIRYGISKIKKLYVLHLIMLAVFYVMVGMPHTKGALEKLAIDVLLLKSWSTDSATYYAYNVVTWYLSTYFFVCILSPYALYLVSRIKNRKQLFFHAAWLYGLMCMIAYGVSVVQIPIGDDFAKWLTYICPLYRIMDFTLGAMLGWLFIHREPQKKVRKSFAFGMELLAVLSFILLEYEYPSVRDRWMGISRTVYFTFAVCLLIWVFATEQSVFTKILNNKFMVWLGELTWITFLTHYVVIRWLKMHLDQEACGSYYYWMIIVAGLGITLGISWFYQYVQKGFDRKKQSISIKRGCSE